MPDNRPFVDYEPVTRRRPRHREADDAPVAENDWRGQAGFAKSNGGEDAATALPLPPAQASPAKAKKEPWTSRHGHTLSFIGLFLFTAVLYFRPYELFPALSSLTYIAFWIAIVTLLIFLPSQLALEGTLTARPREVHLVLLLCCAGALSIFFALDPGEAWATFAEFMKVVAMFIVMVNVARTERRLKSLLLLALAAGFVVSIGVINDYSLGRLNIRGERVGAIIGRGMFNNPNEIALHLVIVTPIAIGLLLSTRSIFKKIIYGVCVALMVVGNVLTFSRGGFLGLVFGVGVLLWKVGRRHRLAVIVLALVLIMMGFALMPGTMVERFASIFDTSGNLNGGGSAIARREVIYRAIIVSSRHPVLGVGMGNFPFVSIHNLVTHNAYLQVAVEIGIPAMICYVLLILSPLKGLRRIEREEIAAHHASRSYYLVVAFQASLVGYMVSSFFDSVAYKYHLYYLVGYALCLQRLYETVWKRAPEFQPEAGERRKAVVSDEGLTVAQAAR